MLRTGHKLFQVFERVKGYLCVAVFSAPNCTSRKGRKL